MVDGVGNMRKLETVLPDCVEINSLENEADRVVRAAVGRLFDGPNDPIFIAVVMATLLNMAGAFMGTAVASTVGKGIVRPEAINLVSVSAAMIGILLWGVFAWYYGIPISKSHALIARPDRCGAGRRGVAGHIVMAWVLTCPICTTIAWGVTLLLQGILT
jgi:phosphate/sulfate permease